ncbi:MAG: glycosyltransferase family 4 protein [Candidatus Komeilibacteria bacterium]|nr:glycosyltransferase family 4 protein [Candidatus Komeilibacteria bacterium]
MQISLLMPHLKVGGGNRRYLEIANRLVKRGHQVEIYHPTGEQCAWTECLAKISPTLEIFQKEHEVLMNSYPVRDEFEIVRRVKAELKLYYVLHLFECELMAGLHPTLYWRNEKTLYTKKSIKTADVVLANSTWQHNWIKEKLGVNNELLIGGVNFELFHPVPAAKDQTKIRLLYSGATKGWKNSVFVEEALKIIKSKYPNVETASYYDQNIPQEKLARFYSSGDIFIDAQVYGGWNNPVVEAMACGIPVVCSAIGSVQDFAFEGRTALLFKLGDLPSCVSQIEKLINSPELRKTLSANALAEVKRFTWDDCIAKFEQIIKENLNLKHAS